MKRSQACEKTAAACSLYREPLPFRPEVRSCSTALFCFLLERLYHYSLCRACHTLSYCLWSVRGYDVAGIMQWKIGRVECRIRLAEGASATWFGGVSASPAMLAPQVEPSKICGGLAKIGSRELPSRGRRIRGSRARCAMDIRSPTQMKRGGGRHQSAPYEEHEYCSCSFDSRVTVAFPGIYACTS